MAKILGVSDLNRILVDCTGVAQTPPNSVEAFNVSQQSGKVIIKLTLKEPLKAPPGASP